MTANCNRCAGTNYLDHAGFGMDPCDCVAAGSTINGYDAGAVDGDMGVIALHSRDLTDIKIIAVMKCRPSGVMTYVIANILALEHGYRGLKTAAVLSRLKRMERAGVVERVGSSYAVQLCWRAC